MWKKAFKTFVNLPLLFFTFSGCSADAIERAWKILDQIPGRATGAYSHSQAITIPLQWDFEQFDVNSFLTEKHHFSQYYILVHIRVSKDCVILLLLELKLVMVFLLIQMTFSSQMVQAQQ